MGISREAKSAYDREYAKREDVKERKRLAARAYSRTDKRRAYMKEYNSRPDVMERAREYQKRYRKQNTLARQEGNRRHKIRTQNLVLMARTSTAHIYQRQCFICHKPYGDGRHFLYHHLWYEPYQKKREELTTPLIYAEYIRDCIKENPNQFMLLCMGCHKNVIMLGNYTPEDIGRLAEAALKTTTSKRAAEASA